MQRKYDIFISYRRLDENGNISGRDQARLIAKQLELEGFHPFFDYSEIKDNEFDKVIIPAIEKCEVFILVLTKDSLNRCMNDEDWVRREIETAISTRCKIINVTPDNAFNGWPTNLPSSLSKIKNIQISEIHMGSLFELSMKKMIDERIIIKLQNNIQDKKENSTNKFVNVHQKSEWLDDALKSNENFSTIFDPDPNTEVVNFVNEEVPIVMFYGPPAVGKTMTIIRLARYLLEHGYTVVPNKVFRSSDYSRYQSLCDRFTELMNSGSVAQGTDIGGTMLIDIIKNGKTIIQFLDTTGEMVDLSDEDKEIECPSYFTQFINTKNPKMWLILLEPHLGDVTMRETYANRIKKLRCCYSRTEDDFVFVYNKIDLTSFVVSYGKVYDKAYINDIKMMYPGLLNFFQIRNPIRKIFQKYSCRILPFQTGSYHLNKYGNQLYIPGPVEYVEELWKVIRYSIK